MAVVLSSAVGDKEVLHKEEVEAHYREQPQDVLVRHKDSTMITEAEEVVEVEDLDGEITTSHSETEIHLSTFVLIGL